MTDTIHLGLPFIDGSQAQKHVTHNEALRILDAAIQIGVEDTTLATPPETPAAGARYLVPSGASGAWSGQTHAVACWEDGAWRFLIPKMGWCVWSAADGTQRVFDGGKWRNMPGGEGTLGAITELGINATPDDDNRLSVCSNAALFRAIEAADDGTGDMRVQISKERADNVASVVFSDAFSGRAEFGLIGSDAFKLKVSDDGTSFTEAFVIDQASGNLTLPRGLALSGVVSSETITANQDDYDPAGLSACSVLQLSADAARVISGLAGGVEGRVLAVLNIGSETVTLREDDASSTAANRFAFGGDIVLGPRHAAVLRYDGTAARWFAVARSGGTGGGGSGSMTSVTAGSGLSGGTITSSGTIALADDIRRNMLLDRIYQSRQLGTQRRVINSWATGFKASTDADRGINAGASSNVDVSAAATSGYVQPSQTAPSQISKGTGINIGTLTANGGLAAAFDGNISQPTASSAVLPSAGPGPSYIGKNYSAAPQKIAQAKTWGSNDTGYMGGGLASTLNLRAKNGSAPASSSDGTLLGSVGPITDVDNANPQTISSNNSATAWDYVWIETVWSGSAQSVMAEVQFFNPGTINGMTLVTASQTTDANVRNARVLLEFDNSGAPALNADLTAEVTCDGGTNWATAPLSVVTSYSQGGRKVVETADQACTAGTSFAARIKTANGKVVPIYGVSVTAR